VPSEAYVSRQDPIAGEVADLYVTGRLRILFVPSMNQRDGQWTDRSPIPPLLRSRVKKMWYVSGE
jgi:hypothetical protein